MRFFGESDDAMDRARRRAGKIRIKLGGRADMPEFIPPKPKGLWHSTYERLSEKAIDAEMAADAAFEQRAAVIIERLFRRTGERISWI